MAISQSADTALLAAEDNADTDPELNKCLDDIQVQTQQAGEFISALRQFMSKETDYRTSLDLNELIRQTIQLINPDARKHSVTLRADLFGIPDQDADRVQIAQILVAFSQDQKLVKKSNNQVQSARGLSD